MDGTPIDSDLRRDNNQQSNRSHPFSSKLNPKERLTMQPDIWPVLEKMQGEIAAEIRVMLGEAPYATSLFDDEQRRRRIEALKKCAAESTSDAERHESWMKMHIESGWVYGESFDPAAKTHPNLLPWEQLPVLTRSKARIFDIVSKAGIALGGAL